jgi:hypothetical protein
VATRARATQRAEVVKGIEVVEVIEGTSLPLLGHLDT